jgi:methionyl-tRNA formyltransferase
MTESLIFAGTPANAAATLEYLVEQGFEVSLVITRPDAFLGRKRILTPSPVAMAASKLGLDVYKTNKIDDSAILKIADTKSSTAVVVAYGALLKAPALAALSNGWFNLHYSLLPKWRGAAPVQHSILAGDKVTGVTLFKIDEGLDTGPVVAAVPAQIQPGETSQRLLARLTELGCTLLGQELPRILLESHRLMPQEPGDVTNVAPKLDRGHARIRWSNSAPEIERQVLAMNPEPGAWTALNGDTFKIHYARELAGSAAGEVGTVSLVDGRVLVSTSAGVLELLEVQPSGKQVMQAKDWARGVSLPVRFDA